jgi:hypothetical protein
MSQTRHKIDMDKEYYEKISNGIIGPEDFVTKSFEFLLKREGVLYHKISRFILSAQIPSPYFQ